MRAVVTDQKAVCFVAKDADLGNLLDNLGAR